MGKRVSAEEIEALMDIYDTNQDDHIDSVLAMDAARGGRS